MILLEVDKGHRPSSVEDAAEYLSRSDIHALIHRRHPLTMKPAAVIRDEIHHQGVDYVVMGGFGHLRLTETLLGGVTRTMLSESPVPTFIAH